LIPQIKPIVESSAPSADTNRVHILLTSELGFVIDGWHNPPDFIRPPDVPIETIESEIINQYATDPGAWPAAVVDRIPFVPWSERHRTLTLTVRQSIADSLLGIARHNEHIRGAFQEFSRDENEAISGPARQLLETLSCRTVFTGAE
jgi:hypothetical protein